MADIDDVRRAMIRGARRGVEQAMNDLAGRAQRDAPILEGVLRASADVDLLETPGEVVGTVSFSTPYAAYQHEHTELVHPRGGKAKYLEDPFNEMLPRYKAAIAASIQREMR